MASELEVLPGDSLPNVIRRKIAYEILEGLIEPGTRLEEKVLTERFHVSRTPIREALRQLMSAHLVEIRPHRGAVVIAPDKHHLKNLFETASEIAGLCAKFAAVRMRQIERKELVELHKKCIAVVEENISDDPADEIASLNRQLQAVMLEGMHNDVFADVVKQILIQTAPYHKSQLKIPGRLTLYNAEYAKVIEAIQAHDGEAAYMAMRDHVTEVHYAALKVIDPKEGVSS